MNDGSFLPDIVKRVDRSPVRRSYEGEASPRKKAPIRRSKSLTMPCAALHVSPAVAKPTDMIRVEWKFTKKTLEKELHAQKFDFLALHREGDHHLVYEGSQYTMGAPAGMIEFAAPSVPGNYRVTLVRDLDHLEPWQTLRPSAKVVSFTQASRTLGGAGFTVSGHKTNQVAEPDLGNLSIKVPAPPGPVSPKLGHTGVLVQSPKNPRMGSIQNSV